MHKKQVRETIDSCGNKMLIEMAAKMYLHDALCQARCWMGYWLVMCIWHVFICASECVCVCERVGGW